MNEIDETIKKLSPWFHNLHLPDGSQTAPDHPLGDFPLFKWNEIRKVIPDNLSGCSVLDIGCNAGFYSFELAKLGAHVTAIDIDEHYLAQAKWAVELYGLTDRIEFNQLQIYDLARMRKKYDIVWYMGVFYHLRYPLLSLDILHRITNRFLIFQTMTIPGDYNLQIPTSIGLDDRELLNNVGWPKMAFIENAIDGDTTNWWVPNSNCVRALLRASGFKITREPSHEVYICELSGEKISIDDIREQEYRAALGLECKQNAL